MTMYLPSLSHTPPAMEGAVTIETQDGIPILRASETVQNRVEHLLDKQHTAQLTEAEERELDGYEEVNDYLSFLNRTVRNMYLVQGKKTV